MRAGNARFDFGRGDLELPDAAPPVISGRRRSWSYALKAELQEEIDTWRAEYGAASPAELREHTAETDDAAETRAIRQTANDWELVQYRLGIVDDAIENYATYSRDDRASASG